MVLQCLNSLWNIFILGSVSSEYASIVRKLLASLSCSLYLYTFSFELCLAVFYKFLDPQQGLVGNTCIWEESRVFCLWESGAPSRLFTGKVLVFCPRRRPLEVCVPRVCEAVALGFLLALWETPLAVYFKAVCPLAALCQQARRALGQKAKA